MWGEVLTCVVGACLLGLVAAQDNGAVPCRQVALVLQGRSSCDVSGEARPCCFPDCAYYPQDEESFQAP